MYYVIPSCIRRFTCEDIAECVDGISDELRATLFGFGYREIESVWSFLTKTERVELSRAANDAEHAASELVNAVL